jgi:guanine nucleotide-binding protein G(i) subunit alpha
MEDIAFISDSGASYRILNFRGPQGERRKWTHYFEAMDAVLFVVDLSAYNDRVLENSTVVSLPPWSGSGPSAIFSNLSWMQTIISESINLYASIANSRFFQNSHLILLFSNIDQFREKVSEGISVKECYQEYTGEDGDAEAVLKFLTDKFVSVHQSDRKAVVEYTHHGDRKILQKLDQCFISSRDLSRT